MSGRWEPRVLRDGESEVAVEARFQQDCRGFSLQYQCTDCVHVDRSGQCSLGWPNQRLLSGQILWRDGIPNFCKAFEAA